MTVAAGGLILHAPTAQAATTSVSASTVTAKASTAAKSAKSAKALKIARQQAKARKAVAAAKAQIGDPYVYGADGPGAFDCSGLTQFAWKKAGVRLPRVAASQFARGRKVSWKNKQPGDLLFFRGLGHVGMYIGHGKMVHSPSSGKRVQIVKLSGWRKASFVGAIRPGM
jgi:cell wall-associated NlpC family hydrolase